MKRIVLLIACLGLMFGCSTELDVPADPRLGERGALRFVGGGCSGSTTMAVGSRETLRVEPVDGSVVPSKLSVLASNPDSIDASAGEASDEIELVANGAGESRVSIDREGALWDALTFRAEPAGAVRFHTVPRVFIGGTVDIVITDVFGACGGEDCPLFGHSFIGWSAEPAEAFELFGDDEGTATFTAQSSGQLLGREPVTGNTLIDTGVEVVPIAGVTGLAATLITIPLEEGEQAKHIELPGAVATNEAFCVQLMALRGDDPPVPLSRRDVRWQASSGLVVQLDGQHASEPLGTIFVAGAESGSVQLDAEIELLDQSAQFELTLTSPAP